MLVWLILGSIILTCIGVSVGFGTQLWSSPQKVFGYDGDTVECDQPSGIWTKAVQVSECGSYNGYRVGTYIAEGQLKTYEWIKKYNDSFQSAVTGRFNVPEGGVRVQYLFEGSTITMSVCLQSTKATTFPVRLLVFDDLDKRNMFIEGKSDGEASVNQQQLPVGNYGQMHCSDVVYRVTHPGYYCIALDSPSEVTIMGNLTENVISVNSSEYQADCTVGNSDPCNIDIPFSPSVRILCHIPKDDPNAPSPLSTSLCSSRQPRYAWTVTGIASPAAIVFIIICVLIITVCLWFIVWCRRNMRRRGYIDISINQC